jgi:hypothetical protein
MRSAGSPRRYRRWPHSIRRTSWRS